MDIDEIIEAQGWNNYTVKELLFQFIEKQHGLEALEEFLTQAAHDENAECSEND